jgi:excisionase family DNA binding protein
VVAAAGSQARAREEGFDHGDRPVAAVLLTVEDAAEALSLGRTKVYELLESGLLPSVKIGRARRIPLSGVREFVQRVAASAEEDRPGSV